MRPVIFRRLHWGAFALLLLSPIRARAAEPADTGVTRVRGEGLRVVDDRGSCGSLVVLVRTPEVSELWVEYGGCSAWRPVRTGAGWAPWRPEMRSRSPVDAPERAW